MTSISNVSIGAKLAGAAAADARHGMNEAIARLSTGRRSMYGGDAAAQAMADNIKARGMSFAVAARNAEDGLSVAQTIESAIMEIASLAQRLRELGIQADNAAIQSTSDIAALDAEAVAVTDAMALIEQTTKFNGKTIIDDADTTINIGVTDGGGTVTITSKLIVDKSDTTSATNAELSADGILADVGESLGNIAAAMTVLKARQAVAYSASANMLAAAARLQDTDFAASSANLAKFSILNQSAMAMVAQANQAQSAVLAVLQ
ncbi:flagellin [Alphaproteobacteria bacterium]|nr:flagellin [Alphaproteobacteria bacterium]